MEHNRLKPNCLSKNQPSSHLWLYQVNASKTCLGKSHRAKYFSNGCRDVFSTNSGVYVYVFLRESVINLLIDKNEEMI